ncbi:hypothetical protein J5N97_002332 [Dioscorea zingiberensis]|uniref:CRAL-TRIO domain-containing protein n=1 Tax=Dioscorea zingiberensis TaxID=325984 RepID=A0A9D5D215_9LILI|nr:hypothetical protein J5N97_002332 [Dioscorea zingiberensis]
MSGSSDNFQSQSKAASKNMPKIRIASSTRGTISQKALSHIQPLKSLRLGQGPSSQVVWFLIKVAALEGVRRLSTPRFPFVWRAVQAFQFLCYPPFKWIQRWAPFKLLVHGAQKLSRPLMLLSITTALSEFSENHPKTFNTVDDSQSQPESTEDASTSDIRNSDEPLEDIVSENWSIQLRVELAKVGITLPERINQDELQRFYTAANGDFSCLLASIKKTIRWRETYSMLSAKELEMWSHWVFWHGFDMMLRPCLIIRLGLACSSLMPQDRPRFVQAIVSQLELGILHLVNEEDPRITVLMDCEGLSPFRFPMNMLRSCSSLVQDHFPNRLATLFLIRLPPLVRVVAQTFIQVLKPPTRQKLRIEGEGYLKALSEYLQQSVPAFLGGSCMCPKCRILLREIKQERTETSRADTCRDTPDGEVALLPYPITELPSNGNFEHILRAIIVAFLMLWIFVAFLAGMHDPDSLAYPPF